MSKRLEELIPGSLLIAKKDFRTKVTFWKASRFQSLNFVAKEFVTVDLKTEPCALIVEKKFLHGFEGESAVLLFSNGLAFVPEYDLVYYFDLVTMR